LTKDRIKAVFCFFHRRGRTLTGANGGVLFFVRYVVKPITLAPESSFNKIQPFLPIAFIVFIVFLLFPNFFYSPVSAGLDASYNVAINLAWKYHLIFGKDFVFTFGPLGILNHRISLAVPEWVYLLSDIYSLATLIHVLNAALYRRLRLLPAVFLFLAFLPQIYGTMFDRYFLFFLFYLFSFIKKPDKTVFLLQAAFLSLLSFYFQVNLGVMAIVLFMAMLIYMLVIKKVSLQRGALILTVYSLALLLSARWLHVDLKGYSEGSFHLIDSFPDAMYLQVIPGQLSASPAVTTILLLAAAPALYLWVASLYKKDLRGHRDEIFIFALLTAVVFIYCKSAFIRQDIPHVINFFKISGLLAALLYLFSPVAERKLVGVCCWSILFISYQCMEVFSGGLARVIPPSLLADKVIHIGNYFGQLATYGQHRDPVGPVNPELKKIIGDHTADVIPWEISKICFNGLRYDPRPVIQSYSVYDPYLDGLNAAKYLSADAPDYILFSVNSIDDRYPFFDESKTKLAIFSHYTIVKEIDGDLLLRKKNREDLIASAAVTTSGKIGEDILLDDRPDLAYAKIRVRYSTWGRIGRLLFQPPPLKITITLQDDETVTYRAIPPMLEDGVIVNRYIRRLSDFRLLMQSAGRLYSPVKKIRFDVDSADSRFADSIELTTVHYSFPPRTGPENVSDSLSIAVLTRQYKPLRRDSSFFKQDNFPCMIDEQESYAPFIRIRAWGSRPGVPYRDIRATAVLKAGRTVYELPSEMEYRSDVAAALPNKDSSTGAGFIARVAKSQLPAGRYQVGILIADTPHNEQWVNYTDHIVVVP